MSSYKRLRGILLIFCLMLIVLAACEYDGPTAMWKNKTAGNAAPTIASIEPASADAGVFEINIIGQNYSETPADNFVYFGKTQAEILQCSSTSITVLRPNTYGDSLNVQVAVSGAIETAKFSPYPVAIVNESFGTFIASETLSAMTVDKDENLFVVLSDKKIVKITPDGVRSDYGEAPYASSDVHCGNDGTLYLQRSNNKKFYRLLPGATEGEEYGTFSNKINFFDFDENGNIYGGGVESGICVIRKDTGKASVNAKYDDFDILAVRVFENFVYVLASYVGKDTTAASGVYRNAITSSFGELGENALVLDWSTTGAWAASEYYDLTFSIAGDMLIATSNADPILRVTKSGSISALYKDILTTTATELVWGKSAFIYQRLGGENQGVKKINIGVTGAPYFGQ